MAKSETVKVKTHGAVLSSRPLVIRLTRIIHNETAAEVARGLGNAKLLWDVKSRVDSTKGASSIRVSLLLYGLIHLFLFTSTGL